MTQPSSKIFTIILTLLIVMPLALIIGGCSKSLAGRGTQSAMTAEPKQEYYELRVYRIASPEKQKTVEMYLENALVPALTRMGLDRVGVFTVMDNPDDLSIYVLIPYPDLQTFAAVNDTLSADTAYTTAAADTFTVQGKDSPFIRIESRLMKAFAGMAVIEVPSQTKAKSPRLFELRIYESSTEEKARLKVEMFNSGEIQVMRDTKLAPVFYGETLISSDVPSMTYMLSASDMEAHKEHWKAFGAHPEWQRLKNLPKYANTVSEITKIFLVPTKYSNL